MEGPTDGGNSRPKRRRNEHQSSWQRKHRQRFGRATGSEVRRDLPHGSRGFLVTCDPKHEQHCFREAVVLLGEQVESSVPSLTAAFAPPVKDHGPLVRPDETADSAGDVDSSARSKANGDYAKADMKVNISEALAAEVAALRKPQEHVFTRVDWGAQGSVFLKVNDNKVVVEDIVEALLRSARRDKTTSSRHCVRFIPVHSTCYAKADEAAVAAASVVRNQFANSKTSYSIVYRSRMNSDAHRKDYIKAIASAIEEIEPGRFKVNLEKPDFVLVVEVVRTVCCIGTFRHFYELAKLNIREVSKPESAEKKSNAKLEKVEDRGVVVEIAAEPVCYTEGQKVDGNDNEHATNIGEKVDGTSEIVDSKETETEQAVEVKNPSKIHGGPVELGESICTPAGRLSSLNNKEDGRHEHAIE